jgi:RNA polymerase sigma-54 factor
MIIQNQDMIMQQKLSPRQILLMRLLQLPILSLEQRIEQELHENPALELTEEDTINDDSTDVFEDEDYFQETENYVKDTDLSDDFNKELDVKDIGIDDYFAENYDEYDYIPSISATNDEKEYPNRNDMYVSGESFQESLLAQLGMFDLSEEDKKIAVFLVGNIDETGYLSRSEENIVNDLLFNINITTNVEHIEELITQVIHKFDPAGIGARNLRECLLVQLERMDEKEEGVILAKKIIEKQFIEFTKKHFDKIKKNLDCSDEEFDEAVARLLKLNPKPGAAFSSIEDSNHIIPDFIVTVNDKTQEVELSLQGLNMPELRMGKMYQSLYRELQQKKAISRAEKREAMDFIKQKVNAAKWFIDALTQREQTMYKTMEAIIDYQKDFFLTGDTIKLKPMGTKDIATEINMDISTVSRVVRLKHVLTPYGVYPLKYFFSESLSKDDGEEVSSHEIKEIIANTVRGEDKDNPYNDLALCDILNEKGYNIARRTVAKYREQLGIQVARLRK